MPFHNKLKLHPARSSATDEETNDELTTPILMDEGGILVVACLSVDIDDWDSLIDEERQE